MGVVGQNETDGLWREDRARVIARAASTSASWRASPVHNPLALHFPRIFAMVWITLCTTL